jgi:hypothetical protein
VNAGNQIMNCEDYRQAVAADPSFDGGAGHLADCSSCQEYRQEMLALERKIGLAMAIGVPKLVMPELPDIESVVTLPHRHRITTPAWFAMAATVVLAAVLGVRMFSSSIEYDSLADEVLAHLQHEPYALRVTDEAVPDARLEAVVPATVAKFDRNAGLITYAQSCVINGNEVPHLVIQGERGPVTILLMPDERSTEAVAFGNATTKGVILPVGGGSIAILGERDERLEKFEQSVVKSVMWST